MSKVDVASNPDVHRDRRVCGGEPVIRGTRFPVRALVVYVERDGLTPEEIVNEWDHLTLAQVHGALAYYYDHKKEIDRLIRENRESSLRRNMAR